MDTPFIDRAVQSRWIRLGVVAVLAMLTLFLLITSLDALSRFGDKENAPVATITVTGTGESTTVPDIARISFTVQETAADVATAQDAATEKTDKAIEAVAALGVEDKDVKTTGYNVYPQYANPQPCYPGVMCPQTEPKITGYQVSQSIDVKVRDTAKAGEVLAALGSLGVQNISGPEFTVDDDTDVAAEARKDAIDDAHTKARELARQLGVRLGDVMSFSESGSPMPYDMSYGRGGVMMEAAASKAPNLPVGEDERSVTVTITYEIR